MLFTCNKINRNIRAQELFGVKNKKRKSKNQQRRKSSSFLRVLKPFTKNREVPRTIFRDGFLIRKFKFLFSSKDKTPIRMMNNK